MNRKLCKKLRGQARARTEGAANVAYERVRDWIELAPHCTRYVYHALKQVRVTS